MRLIAFGFLAIFCFGFMACNQAKEADATAPKTDPVPQEAPVPMNSYLSSFEIPAADLGRAVGFYEAVLGIEIEQMEIPGMKMGLFPYEGQVLTGIIVEGEGYNPSPDGVAIYLNAGDQLESMLEKVEANGGSIVVPKTAHADESGYFAMFLDSEGNRIGLNSPNSAPEVK